MMDPIATAKIEAVKGNPAIAYYSAPDEPDGADSTRWASACMAARSSRCTNWPLRSIPRHRVSFRSTTPIATSTITCIAETMDYSASHRYNLGQGLHGHEGILRAQKKLRDAAEPLPFLWVTQLYPHPPRNSANMSKYNGRDPLPPEMHIQMLEALGGGTKGFIHYIHSGSSGGRGGSGTNKPLWDSMGPMHQQIALVGDVAVHSTPVDWATSPTPNVHAAALLADSSNLLVVLTNDGFVSNKPDIAVPEITGISVIIATPSWVHATSVLEVQAGGETRNLSFTSQDSGITVPISSMKEGTILWLKGSEIPRKSCTGLQPVRTALNSKLMRN